MLSILTFLLFALPIITSVWFFISLSSWLSTPKDRPERNSHKTMMFVSGGITLFLIISLFARLLFVMMSYANSATFPS